MSFNSSHKIIQREWWNHKIYPLLFSLCLLISLTAYMTLDSLQVGVDDYVGSNQKQIVGGDLILQSRQDFPQDIKQYLQSLDPQQVVYDYQFNAIAYTEEESLLARVKAVSSAYPLYGKVVLQSGESIQTHWPKGEVIVEKQILTGLNVKIGDSIKLGESVFKIADEILIEPDRPLTAFGFGARVLMHESDLKQTELMGQRSRINYRVELKADEQQAPLILNRLKELTKDTKIDARSSDESNTSISGLSQNFLRFLKLLVVAVIILSGIGIMSMIKAFVNRQRQTNAIRRALGEPAKNIVNSYRWLLISMTLGSVFLAWLLSLLVLYWGEDVFAAILPADLVVSISWLSLVKAALIACLLTLFMTSMTLQSLHDVKPLAALHNHQLKSENTPSRKIRWLWFAFAALGLYVLLYSELDSWLQSLQVLVGLIVIWCVFWLLSWLLMKALKLALKKNWISQWLLKLSLQNIFRKGNHSTLFIAALSMTTMVLGSITFLDYSIQQQLIATYPKDAPNLFLLDVQTDQTEEIAQMVGDSVVYYPVIRARIDSVNGVKVEVIKDQLGRYDNIMRVFNLSYANEVLKTEKITDSVVSGQLFDDQVPKGAKPDSVPISILNTIADFLQVKIGDEIVFNVQGVKITTHIDSVRERYQRGPSPFFYFIFQPEVMQEAPQIRFATAKVEQSQTAELQTAIAKKFPGITTLDGGSIANKLGDFVDQLKALVQVFTGLSVFAGLLIFASSLVATSQDRLRESHFYRLMGMNMKDLSRLSLIEFLALGLFAFLLGILIAAVASYVITTHWFALQFIFPWRLFALVLLVYTGVLLGMSFLYSQHVRRSKVIEFIRAEV